MNLQARVKAILTSPKTEWEVIAAEQTDIPSLYRNYIVILAAIPAICSFVGLVDLRLSRRRGARSGAVSVATYVLSLVGPFVAAS